MSERKVLNKYFPPDFDPAKIPRRKMAEDAQHKVRLMAPFSMRCETCGDYIYKGKKFNARKEKVIGEHYLGILIFRFYIRCPRCSAEITFKTDPKNTDYVCEHGALRNFEPWREETDVKELQRLEKEKEEENNPIKALENRTVASKVEMDILDALDEIRTRNAASERLDAADVLGRLQQNQRAKVEEILRKQDEEDEEIARAVFKSGDDGLFVRRLVEGDGEADGGFTPPADILSRKSIGSADISVSDWAPVVKTKGKRQLGSVGLLAVASTKKPKAESKKQEPNSKPLAVIAAIADYASDSD
ncbi:hypothetical protein HDU83_005149 [Entophlyctis luteolus]|nr:hypothetical protein HDU82_002546 [Entophlyctis luteolus]KAJ3344479.1 hypothetical protein HDU83_005149 [Entophlyctis luteolus]KAJ3385990.1 hypothetical protein HDU84_001874 [Entophlyctis sp. JEL0112]